MDGQVWKHFGKFRNVWFLDMPTVLSTDPQELILPKEVATADELQPKM